MTRFILKFKMRGRANRERPDETLEKSEIVLGSRPLADVYVPDRLVPQEALVFHFDGAHLTMDLRGRLAGVFVDGRPVEGRVAVRSGALVHVGHAVVECLVDPAKGECTLTTNEQQLAAVVDGVVMKAKPAKAFALVDAGPQEHRWGKSPVMRRANWIAAAAGALLLGAFPFVRGSQLMSRGELFHAHQIGVKDGPKDCAACHAPFSSDYDAKCAACHAGFEGLATHPYASLKIAPQVSCNGCHGEHVGADAQISPVIAKGSTGWPAACVVCHAKLAVAYPAADVSADVVEKSKSRLRDARGEPFSRQLLVDGFSHADHRVPKHGVADVPGGPPKKGQAPLKCDECHKLLAKNEKPDAGWPTQFAKVAYEKCLECHADWRVSVHGRDADGAACYACHAKAETPAKITAALKTVELPATEGKWVLKPRGHDFQKDECLKCHVLGRAADEHKTSIGEKTFRHDHHLRAVAPRPGAEMALARDCVACHDSVAGSETLAGTPLVNTKGCVKCHVDSEPTPVPAKEGATRRVGDMFHRVHAVDAATAPRGAVRGSLDSLALGCLSCHAPVSGDGTMGFVKGAQDCKACHESHENVGQGKCVLCHVDRAPGRRRVAPNGRVEFPFNEPGIFNREKAVMKSTSMMPRFDHRSAGHVGHACAECHREKDVDGATRVLDVAWPAFDEDACVKCHVRERFHR